MAHTHVNLNLAGCLFPSLQVVKRPTVPAVVGGNDQCVAHTGSSQAVPQLVEEPVEQRLERQDQQSRAHEEAAGVLHSTWSIQTRVQSETDKKTTSV